MITVRYPTGVAIRYPKAAYVYWSNGTERHSLYTAKDGNFVASVPIGCGIEFEEGAVVTGLSDYAAIEQCANETHRLKFLPYGVLKRLKQALAKFDIRTGRWHND